MLQKARLCALVLPALVTLAVITTPTPASALSARQGEGENLLDNPGFEEPFIPDVRSDGGGFVAHGWSAWWYNDSGGEFDGPEYKQAHISIDPYRVRSGENAQQYFRPWARHQAGIYQNVQVPTNSQLRFTIYGHAWSTFCGENAEGDLDCDARNSHYGMGANPISMQIGIDPTGGVNPFSDAIVWSASQAVYDNYQQFSVEATAQGDHVTVYVYSIPEWPAPVINVYWDDASLVVIGEGEAPPSGGEETSPPSDPGSSPAPGGFVGTIPTQDPQPDGSIVHVVQSGDTLGGIAWAYGVETQALRDLNHLTSDIIITGQTLLIRPASASGGETAAEPAPEVEATEESAEAEEGEPTEEGEAEIAQAAPDSAMSGTICARLFEDINSDGVFSSGDMGLSGGVIELFGASTASYTTAGESEPYCFENLTPGDYIVSVQPPPGYQVGGIGRVPVTLTGGGRIALEFSMMGASEESELTGGENEVGEQPPRSGIPPLTIIGGVLLLVVVGGVASYFLFARRRSMSL